METTLSIKHTLPVSCSYPTYEEWKPSPVWLKEYLMKGSYPTYEEWKPICVAYVPPPVIVLILPMRNGNATARTIALSGDATFLSYL